MINVVLIKKEATACRFAHGKLGASLLHTCRGKERGVRDDASRESLHPSQRS